MPTRPPSPSAAFNREVAALIDRRIRPAYRLYPNNYIAADILSGKRTHSYTEAEYQRFQEHLKEVDGYPDELRDILLHIYANPVIS